MQPTHRETAPRYERDITLVKDALESVRSFIIESWSACHDSSCKPNTGCTCYVSLVPDAADAMEEVRRVTKALYTALEGLVEPGRDLTIAEMDERLRMAHAALRQARREEG